MSPLTLDLPSGPAPFHGLVLDYTGTLSLDGTLLPGVAQRLRELSEVLEISVLTADTFGTARESLAGMPVQVEIIANGREKAELVSTMGPGGIIAVGNGRNDIPMMDVAGLAVAVLGPEGAAAGLLSRADIVTRDILDALDHLLHPLRARATLRD